MLFGVQVLESEARGNVCILLAPEFHIGIDKVVERVSILPWSQTDISSDAELNAIFIPMAEKEFSLFRVLPGFRDIHGHPSAVLGVEVGPAVIAGNLTGVLVGRKRKSDLKARGNTLRARHGYEQ